MTAPDDRESLLVEVQRLRRAVEELSILNDLARAIGTTLDDAGIMQTVIQRSVEAVGAEQAAITLVDRRDLVPAGTVVRAVVENQSELYRLNQSLLGMILHTKRSVRIDDPAADPRLDGVRLEAGVRNLLAVPLLAGSELIGVLIAYNKREASGFDAGDQRLLAIIAAQSAQVLERARLLDEEKEATRLREEVRFAGQIQSGLLPANPPDIPGYDIAGLSLPAREVGGDYFDYIAVDDHRWALALGDVSGKGLPASLLMANLQATLRSQALRGEPAGVCVGWCNRLLSGSTAPEKFVTLFYAVLDLRTHTLSYCNAGHEHPFLMPAAGGEPVRLGTDGLILGVREDYAYGDRECPLVPGDLLVAFSDGLTDATDTADEPFGEERLAACLRELHERPAREIVEQVVAAVRAHTEGAEPADDLTLLLVKRLP